jgi:hypothetical protein
MASRQTISVSHPYRGLGLALIIVSLVLIAFDIGVLARCGAGEGICFDIASHGTSVGALVAFFVLFVVGVMLLTYAGTTTSTVVSPPPASPAPVTVVVPPPPAPSPPGTTVTVNPPPGTSQ